MDGHMNVNPFFFFGSPRNFHGVILQKIGILIRTADWIWNWDASVRSFHSGAGFDIQQGVTGTSLD
jgi:hypothetical protein